MGSRSTSTSHASSDLQGTLGDDHSLSRKARKYGETVVTGENWQLDDLDLSKLTWETSTRAKRQHGRCLYGRNGQATIRLSEHTYKRADFEACKTVIRHELVHAWQHQHHGETRTVAGTEIEVDYGHRETFRVWIDPLNLDGRCAAHYAKEREDYRYVYECPSCSSWAGKHRLCKSVRQAASGGESDIGYRYCGACEVRMYLVSDGRYLAHGTYSDEEIKRFVNGDPRMQEEYGVWPRDAAAKPRRNE